LFLFDLSSDYYLRDSYRPVASFVSVLLAKHFHHVHNQILLNFLIFHDDTSILKSAFKIIAPRQNGSPRQIIVINFDEMNVVKTGQSNSQFSSIFNAIMDYLRVSFEDEDCPFIYLTFSGTNVTELPKLLKLVSHIDPVEINLPLLTEKHCFKIIKSVYKRIKNSFLVDDFKPSNDFKKTVAMEYLVSMTDGIPRYMEALLFAVGCTESEPFSREAFLMNAIKEDLDHKAVLGLASRFINESYFNAYTKISNSNQIPFSLVLRSLFDIPTSREFVFRDENVHSLTLSSLESDGLVFLKPTATSTFLITIPLELLRNLVLANSNFGNKCPRILHSDTPGSSDDSEIDELKIFYLRILLANHLHSKQLSICVQNLIKPC
jgi:hypothetical protein